MSLTTKFADASVAWWPRWRWASVGTAMGLINDIPTVGDLVSRIVEEAEELITGRLADMIEPRGRRERGLEKAISANGPNWANCRG